MVHVPRYEAGVSFLLALIASVIESDATLAARIAAQDPAALRRLFDRTSGRVRAIALRVLGSAGDADDVVQDTFLEVWRSAAAFDGERGSLMTWIATIAHRRAVDRLRRRATRPLGPLGDAPSLATADPRETAVDREARTRVVQALAALGDEQRTALELMYYRGLSQRETADQLGVALGTLKSRVRAAMSRLAALLDEPNPEAP
jgi:RNA polymerase sigma-70 factor (ECF subfamily)